MIRKVKVEWQGGMSFESDDPSGNTTLMDTHVRLRQAFWSIAKNDDVVCSCGLLWD